MGSELLCYVCYVISWYAIVPAIVRIFRRKSSSDYSLQSAAMEIAYNVIWLVYVLYNPTFELVFCAVVDVIIISVYAYAVIRYYK